MAAAMNRLMQRQLSRAWEKWQYEYAEELRLKALLANACLIMRNMQLGMAFKWWRHHHILTQKTKADPSPVPDLTPEKKPWEPLELAGIERVGRGMYI